MFYFTTVQPEKIDFFVKKGGVDLGARRKATARQQWNTRQNRRNINVICNNKFNKSFIKSVVNNFIILIWKILKTIIM